MDSEIPTLVKKMISTHKSSGRRIAEIGGFGKSYVSMVLDGKRPASERLLRAVMVYLVERVLDAEHALAWCMAEQETKALRTLPKSKTEKGSAQ